jgi:hypothetical protein
MAVFAAAIMFAISVTVVLGGVVSERGRVAVTDSRRPPRTGVTLALFSLAVVGALMGAGLGGRPSTPQPSAVGPAPSSFQSAVGAVPVYPGPSNGAPLPRLNLPITYDYGPGPRHPVPPPGSAPPSALGANSGVNSAPEGSGLAPSTTPLPPPPVPLPSCLASAEPGAPGAGGVRVIAPCLGR